MSFLRKQESKFLGKAFPGEIVPERYFVYILASRRKGTLYIGVTRDLVRRVWEHKEKVVVGFAERYNVDKLVHYEEFADIREAIIREKRMKKWKRQWKVELIEQCNLKWKDLYCDIAK